MKKGFTLIELLAVILILGIIALIAIPQVTTIIEDSKINSGKVSVKNYVDAVEDFVIVSKIDGTSIEGMYSKSELDESGLKTSGDIKNVRVVIDSNGNVSSGQFCANGKSFTYDGQNVFYQEVLDLCNDVILTKVKEVFVSNVADLTAIFAIDENNTLYGWGRNRYNMLLQDGFEYKTPVKVGTDLKFKKVVFTANGAVLGITTDGKLYSWGYDDGLLGFDNLTWDSIGMREVLPGVNIIDVAVSYYDFVVALDSDGNVYAWGKSGWNAFNTEIAYTPTKIYSNTNYKSIYASCDSVIALDNNGDIWSWGSGNLLADGNTGSSYRGPAKRTNGLNIKKIDIKANPDLALALSEDGKVYSWGNNHIRGLTSLYDNVSPITSASLVKEDSNIVDVAISYDKSLLLYNDGTILEAHGWEKESRLINTGKKIEHIYIY